MSTSINRRDFLKSGTAAAATPALFGAVADAASLFAPSTATASVLANGDLLRAIGQRIGFDAVNRVAPNGEAVSLMYFDYAGPTIDPLREGIAQALLLQSAGKASVNEIDLPYGELLGVALIRNLETAVETRIEIDAMMLSHLALIESTRSTVALQTQLVMAASANHFYRTADLIS